MAEQISVHDPRVKCSRCPVLFLPKWVCRKLDPHSGKPGVRKPVHRFRGPGSESDLRMGNRSIDDSATQDDQSDATECAYIDGGIATYGD